jgi:Kef-type K+ transport system membrane component KefB
VIILFCRLLHWPLSKIRQPRVIAEVIGGVLLGPSVMGRIPGFTATIFPAAAQPNLALVANIGLVLFLFIVGLEVDLRYLASNWKIALSVGLAGMALPFGLGCGIAYGLYHQFSDEDGTEPVAFGTFMLFVGVAMAITAFPVLCRILTELKLLSTSVGVIVLSAGAGNDVTGWVLLALCVALVNSGSGISALYVLLTALGYTLFLFFAVKPAFTWVLRRTRTFENGPSQGIIVLTLLIALASSFFTGVIGIHPIFGAFMAGLICPHEGGFAIKVTEKIEDLISALFLPLYFALSGLSTNLGLLDTAITWGYVVGVLAVAFVGKFVGASLAARANGVVWRESFTIGALMSCKGLVELIVLNIGLQAKILSQRTFTIFVVMALITTFITTPLTMALYPPWYQKKLEAWKKGLIDWDTGNPIKPAGDDASSIVAAKLETSKIKTLLVHLRLDNMPTLMTFVSLLAAPSKSGEATARQHPIYAGKSASINESIKTPNRPLEVHGVRMIELTDRDSSVMSVSDVEEFHWKDPIINTFRNFGRLYNLSVSGEVAIALESSFAEIITSKAASEDSDLLVLPWSESGSMNEQQSYNGNPTTPRRLEDTSYVSFVAAALKSSTCNTAVFVNRGFGGSAVARRPTTLSRQASKISLSNERGPASSPIMDKSHHIYMPYFGGADGRVALRLVLQLAENPDVTATIVFFDRLDGNSSQEPKEHGSPMETTRSTSSTSETKTTAVARIEDSDETFFAMIQRSLPTEVSSRLIMEHVSSHSPLEEAISRAAIEVAQNPKNAGDLIVVGRRDLSSESGKACLGLVAQRFVDGGLRASILVMQARPGQQGVSEML